MISATRIEPGNTSARAAHALAMHAATSPQLQNRPFGSSASKNAGAGVRRQWSEKFPPVFRGISPAQGNVVGFEHAGGISNLNCIRIEKQTRADFSWAKNWEPCATSILSGLPSFVYHSAEVRVPLTRGEIVRLLRFSLSRGEYFRLAEKFGVFFEICPFFYNEDTGEALHPMKGDTEEARQRHTQILALTPGAIPPPEPGQLPEDLVAYLKGESETVGAAAPVENDLRPYLVVLNNDDGTHRAHSIMTQAAAYAFRDEVKDQTDMEVLALPLLGPSNAWRPDPFDNFVVLNKLKSGAFEAYGRFAARKDANKFATQLASAPEHADFVVATVTSSYLGRAAPGTTT